MQAYCVKCKEKQEINDPLAVFTTTGTPATKGSCLICGTNVFRMGRTDAHKGMEPPKNPELRRRKKREVKRSGKLVIVESPAKARTIGRYLGKGYKVKASVGHVRDLLRSQLSVDVENDFHPKYRVPNDKRPVIKEIKALAAKAEKIYLATDLDREGEAIAWHLLESAEMEPERTQRVIFHEITSTAIDEAFANPRNLDMNLVNAQQGRRILDRLVGYSISPLLWKKVRGRLSAGRVQSVALRIICDREREIEAFNPDEYWSIEAELNPGGKRQNFTAKLARVDGEKTSLKIKSDVETIVVDMEKAKYHISKTKVGKRQRKPSAPFTTSTLQQAASRRLKYTARRTMRIAQQLYEGVEIGNGDETGLITYMRTDSVNISKIAQEEARTFITSQYGNSYLPDAPPLYKTKASRAQEAHEAVRPTSVLRTPKAMKQFLTRDQHRLYQIIWQSFVASQMANAIFDTIAIDIDAKGTQHRYLLRASGSTIKFDGFLVVYKDMKDRDKKEQTRVPTDLTVGQLLTLIRLLPEQHFTQPPARFSDASLVSALEENGIGRPSTYAPTISTLHNRNYIYREDRRLYPTETGIIVNDLLVEHFPNIVDTSFTAKMEASLDKIASGNVTWVDIVRDFYGPFSKTLELAKTNMPDMNTGPELVGRECPICGKELVIRWGRHGKFIGCENFPECRHTEAILEKIGIQCPDDGGELVKRKTRRGRIFFGCENYPTCEFSSWKLPVKQSCPNCSGLLITENKQHLSCLKCEEQFLRDEIIVDDAEDIVELA